MAKQGDLKYIYAHGCVDEFYNRKSDPHELNNLALDPARADDVARLRFACLRDWELDEHPQLTLYAKPENGRIELTWGVSRNRRHL